MDDNAKNTCSYQVDQDLLDARGINMTVEEVAGLSTSKYSERVQSQKLCDEDLAFLKGLRRRIKNRLASQNSRRRSVEHLRRLTRELRAVRACRRDALAERRALVLRRDAVRDKCATLRRHLLQILQSRSDTTEVPSIDVIIESQPKETKKCIVAETKTPVNTCSKQDQHISVIVKNNIDKNKLRDLENDEDIYERVRQELQKEIEVKEMKETIVFNEGDVKETLIIKEEPEYDEITIEDEFVNSRCYDQHNSIEYDQQNAKFIEYDQQNAKFIEYDQRTKRLEFENGSDFDGRKLESNYRDVARSGLARGRDIFECKIGKLVTQSVNHIFNDKKKVFAKTVFFSNDKLSSSVKTVVLTEGADDGVLNLSVKEGRRKIHGRKQSAPRRIAYSEDCDDVVLDLKINKEPQ